MFSADFFALPNQQRHNENKAMVDKKVFICIGIEKKRDARSVSAN
jgi:hypothetical protein